MLRIRQDQTQVLGSMTMERSEREILGHVRRVFGAEVAHLENEQLVELIRRGVQKAAGYQIVSERLVALFVDLMLYLEPDFDLAPETAWAREILDNTRLSPSARMRLLYEELRTRAADHEGPDGSAR